MQNLSVPQMVSMLEQYIVEEPTLLSYAENDLANLKELVNEFVGSHYMYECTDGCTKLLPPKALVNRILNVFLENKIPFTIEEHALDSIIGYCYLIRSHIRFYQNEKKST